MQRNSYLEERMNDTHYRYSWKWVGRNCKWNVSRLNTGQLCFFIYCLCLLCLIFVLFLLLLFFNIFFSYARVSVRTDSYAADLASIAGFRLSAATRWNIHPYRWGDDQVSFEYRWCVDDIWVCCNNIGRYTPRSICRPILGQRHIGR